jgi:hypothetical protein
MPAPLYAWVKLADTNLALVSDFNAVCCLVVLLLAACRRTLATVRLDDHVAQWAGLPKH